MKQQRLLAGDVGGTTTRLVLAESQQGSMRVLAEQHYHSARYPGLAEVVVEFLSGERGGPIAAACFGVAGPVRRHVEGEAVKVTNLPWEITGAELSRTLGIPRLQLMNDFEAVAYGIDRLDDHDQIVLQAGQPERGGPRAVLGAGTGLGQTILVGQAGGAVVIPTEGGHVDFGPTDPLQVELARWLIHQQGRASYEDILSGGGLARIYVFLRERGLIPESPATAAAMESGAPAAAICSAALNQQDPLALATLDLFVKIYGAQTANLALATGATGGVYVAGGMALHLLEKLRDGVFLSAFRDKGRMTEFLKRIPLRVIIKPDVGLRGALTCAERMLAVAPLGPPDQRG